MAHPRARLSGVALALMLCLVLSRPAAPQALNPFESFDDNFKQLKDRIRFYQENYSEVVIPPEMKPEKLAQLGAQGGSMNAVRKLRVLTEMLDRIALGVVKREVYNSGLKSKTQPTAHENYAIRSTLLIEFGAIVKRQKLHFPSYFPKGEGYLQRLKVETDASYRLVDEMLSHLVVVLKEDVEKAAASGGGGESGGGESGSGSGAGGEVDPGGGGGFSSFEEPPSPGADRPRHPQPVPAEREIPWFLWLKVITSVGLAIFLVGSILALTLPRVRKGMWAVLTSFGFGKPSAVTVEDHPLKRAIALAARGDYRRALPVLSKIKDPTHQNEVVYYRALCHARLLETVDAGNSLATLTLTAVGSDDLFRLAQACEEASMVDWAVKILDVVAGRDMHFRNVMAKLARLKEHQASAAVGQGTDKKAPDPAPAAKTPPVKAEPGRP